MLFMLCETRAQKAPTADSFHSWDMETESKYEHLTDIGKTNKI